MDTDTQDGRGRVSTRILVLLLVVGVAIGVLATAHFDGWPFLGATEREAQVAAVGTGAAVRPTPSAGYDTSLAAATRVEEAFVHVAETVGPAVVSISTQHVERVSNVPYGLRFGGPFGGDPFFEQFLHEFFGDASRTRQGLGSGVIVDARGYVLTNEHVVANASQITVTLPDGREFDGQVRGTDPRSDLAIIQIKGSHLPNAPLGDSDHVKPGHWVVALGNPFGYVLDDPEPTMTVGVISALHRHLPGTQRNYSDLIQTDAAINPGNSGGPLVNVRGEVIGVNVAIFSTTGGSIGLGFAIPVNRAKDIITSLIAGREVEYGWLGVSIQDVTAEVAAFYGLSRAEGALIYQVLPDGPADRAGLQAGDIVRRFGDRLVKDASALLNAVGQSGVGSAVTAEILRGGRVRKIEVTIGKRPGAPGAITAADHESSITTRGARIGEITEPLRQRFRLPADMLGVVVIEVEPGSPAAFGRLRVGDVVHQVNDIPVRSVSEFRRAMQRARGDVLLRTARGFIVLPPASD